MSSVDELGLAGDWPFVSCSAPGVQYHFQPAATAKSTDKTAALDGNMEALVNIVMLVLLVLVLAVWAVVGLVFWIPLLTRAVLVFTASVVHAVITGQRTSAMRDYLRDASRFWFEGFFLAKDTVYPPPGEPSAWKVKIRIGRSVTEILWAAAFWLAVVSLLNLKAARQVLPEIGRRIGDAAIVFSRWANRLEHNKVVLLTIGALLVGMAAGMAISAIVRNIKTSRHEKEDSGFIEENQELRERISELENV